MTLTVADIERWDAGSVREVFHAATSRAQAAADAANGLATLPAFETWGGVAAEAAKEAIGKTRRDLDAHGREAQAVAIADVYDALRSKRAYKSPFDHERARRIILEGDERLRPGAFGPKMLDIFRALHKEMAEIYDLHAEDDAL